MNVMLERTNTHRTRGTAGVGGSLHKSAWCTRVRIDCTGLVTMYARDYATIGMLGIRGCGELLMCEQATQEMANSQLPT